MAAVSVPAAAERVLRHNDNGRYTVPSRSPTRTSGTGTRRCPRLGWAELDSGRAWTELESSPRRARRPGDGSRTSPFTGASPTGSNDTCRERPRPRSLDRIPATCRDRAGGVAASRLDGRRISGDHPAAARRELRPARVRAPPRRAPRPRAAAAPARLAPLPARPSATRTGLGEPVLVHPWESGRDNALEWDGPLWRVTPERDGAAPARHGFGRRRRAPERRALSPLPHARPPRHGLRLGPGAARARGPFRVLDPGFCAILARACLDLAWLAGELGEGRIAGREPARRRAGRGRAARSRRRRRPDPGRRRGATTRRSPATAPARALAAAHARPRATHVRRRAQSSLDGRLSSPVRGAVARPRPSGALAAQLLARTGVGQRHLALRARRSRSTARAQPRRRCARGCCARSRAAACASTSSRTPGAASARTTSPGRRRSACASRAPGRRPRPGGPPARPASRPPRPRHSQVEFQQVYGSDTERQFSEPRDVRQQDEERPCPCGTANPRGHGSR